MRYRLLLVIFLGVLVFGFSMAAVSQDAAATFKAKCVMCHGADAAGKTPMGAKLNIPDLRAPEIQKKSVAELATAIAKGKNKMPAFENKLSAAEVTQLAEFVHKLKK
jgi:mono/diheme cytochrome c family protein